jgi:hypothetical protein
VSVAVAVGAAGVALASLGLIRGAELPVAVVVPDAVIVRSWPLPAAPSEKSFVVPAGAVVSGAPGPAEASTMVARLCDTSDVVALMIGELTDSVAVTCCELIDVVVPVTVEPESSAET